MITKNKKNHVPLISILFPISLILEGTMFFYDGNEYHWDKIGIIFSISLIISIYIFYELNEYVEKQIITMLKSEGYSIFSNIAINTDNGYVSVKNVFGYTFFLKLDDISFISCSKTEKNMEIMITTNSDEHPTINFFLGKEDHESALKCFKDSGIDINFVTENTEPSSNKVS